VKQLSLTLVLVIGVIGGVVVGYAASSLSHDDPLAPITPSPTEIAPSPTPTPHTVILACDDPHMQVTELCFIGPNHFPLCSQMGLGPGQSIGMVCLNDGKGTAEPKR
jgi:hypothetical protein